MSRRPPNGSKNDLKDKDTRGKCYASSKKESELQPSLHSCKEQKRRLQIRTCCRRLCDLLPFVEGQLDTATTLELTAKYTSYLKQTLPPSILSKVNKAVEANMNCSWKNVKMPQKKRRTVGQKKNTLPGAKPAAKKSTKDHVSRRCTQQICKQVTQPSSTATSPLTMDQMLPPADSLTTAHAPPILLDKSAVPRGQMLPVCQDQFLSSSFQSVEKNWINLTSAFINPTSCAFPPAMIRPTFLPQVGSHPSSSHALWDVDPGLVDPVALPSVNFGQAYSPPDPTAVANFITPPVEQGPIHSSLVGTTDSDSAVDFTNQPLIPFSMFQSATTSSNELTPEAGNVPVPDALCDSRLLQESDLCSSSPLTDSPQDVVNPLWLDLLLDTNGSLCFPDANLVNVVLSPYTGSN
ncbi:uncharacterized protein LOC116671454 [Etheostoma spectabile]|uniref:uncharacterized protein LOC116671454 n=1 Tax=Etheostoma spectabile TaxID=54343 RepID=UPI0013AF5D7D|nr:spermatogenesis- and oogenesis-specific basic helix-loop-helix-containing protein 2 [Etheostoma spectabile]